MAALLAATLRDYYVQNAAEQTTETKTSFHRDPLRGEVPNLKPKLDLVELFTVEVHLSVGARNLS